MVLDYLLVIMALGLVAYLTVGPLPAPRRDAERPLIWPPGATWPREFRAGATSSSPFFVGSISPSKQ